MHSPNSEIRYPNTKQGAGAMRPVLWFWASLWLMACSSASDEARLQPLGPQTVQVGEELTVELVVLNAGGSAPVFSAASPSLPDLQTRAYPPRFVPFGAGAYFRWVPVASDVGQHVIELSARVGSSADSQTFTVDIIPGSASPVFVKPLGAGKTLDLAQAQCFEVDIEVQDPDTQEVNIFLEQPIEDGFQLLSIPPSKAKFTWCPSNVQAQASTRYSVNFAADDGNGHVARRNYTLLLRTRLGQDCENGEGTGRPPRIEHRPPTFLEAGDSLELTALIADDKGLAGPPRFYYTFAPPADGINFDLGELSTVEMTRESGSTEEGLYKASVPIGPTLNVDGSDAVEMALTDGEIYYLIEATDDDDIDGDCDNRVVAPEESLFMATFGRAAASDAVTGEVCQPCASDADCGADVCIPLFEGGQYCLPRCSSGPIDRCGVIGFQGCCEDNTVTWCGGSEVQSIPCQMEGSCGWNADEGTYGCRTDGGEDPSGRFPKACPTAQSSVCPTGHQCSVEAKVSVGGVTAQVCVPDADRCAGQDCVDDTFEDNDSQAQAMVPIGLDRQYTDLRLCGDGMAVDDDYYGLFISEETDVRIAVTFQHELGDLDVSLLNSSGQIMKAGYSTTDNEEINICLSPDYYYLHIWSIRREVNTSYGLSIETQNASTCCQNDTLEDNNTPASASPLDAGGTTTGQICPNDEDWFTIALDAGDTVALELTFDQNSSDQDLDLFLLDTDAVTTLAQAITTDSNESISQVVASNGTYYVAVKGFAGASNAYTIQHFVSPEP